MELLIISQVIPKLVLHLSGGMNSLDHFDNFDFIRNHQIIRLFDMVPEYLEYLVSMEGEYVDM